MLVLIAGVDPEMLVVFIVQGRRSRVLLSPIFRSLDFRLVLIVH